MDEIQAAVLSVKLMGLDKDNERRREVAKYYSENIKNPHIKLPFVGKWEGHVFHQFVIRCQTRDKLQQFCKIMGLKL